MLVDFCCMHMDCVSGCTMSKDEMTKELSARNIKTAMVFYEYPLYRPVKSIEVVNGVYLINGITYSSREGLVRIFIPDCYYRPFSNENMSNDNLYKLVKTLGGTVGIVGQPMFKNLKYDYAEITKDEVEAYNKNNKLRYFIGSRAMRQGNVGDFSKIASSEFKNIFDIGGVKLSEG